LRGASGYRRWTVVQIGDRAFSAAATEQEVVARVPEHDADVHFPFGLEPSLRLIRTSVGAQGPDEPSIFGPVLRHEDLEHPPAASSVEMRRLAAIAAFFEAIIRPDRDVYLFLGVSVEVAEIKIVGPVGIAFPAVERWADVLSARIRDL